MQQGQLWFDNSEQRELSLKIERAAQYYQSKYGTRPTLCIVHPKWLDEPTTINGIEVRPKNSVLENHFWLGILDNSKASAS